MCDIYLGGSSGQLWRKQFKDEIGTEISIFDPVSASYDNLTELEKINEIAKSFYQLEKCSIIVFCFDNSCADAISLIKLGDCIARNKHVVVCIDGEFVHQDDVKTYCEYHSVVCVRDIEDLITTTEEYLAQIEMCKV